MAHGKYWVNNHAHVIDAHDIGLLTWIEKYINSIDLKPYVTGSAQPKMNQAKMNSILVALPPVNEQHRIVAKIDGLMTLCDTLDQQIDAATTKQAELLNALMLAQSQVNTTGEPQQTPLHCHESSGDPHDPPRYAPRSGNRAPVVTA